MGESRGSKISRRRFVTAAGAGSASVVLSPFVRTANAAGKLSVGLWDHWIPSANDTSRRLVEEWAAREKVDVQVDYITSQGEKLRLLIAAESLARTGHDVLQMPSWWPRAYAGALAPVDDIMADLVKLNGPIDEAISYLARADGHWIVVPSTVGSQIKGPCSRIDLMKRYAGIDVQALYPAGAPARAESWTLEAFITAAEACHKAGFPFGIGLGTTADSVDTAGAIFQSFGAALVDASGTVTVRTDAVRQALDYYTRCARFFPPDAPAWDDAANNRWLVAGRGALIMNPPSAWAVARRDAPHVAAQLWTHGMPAGPKGRFAPFIPNHWGIWGFSQNISAAKSLLWHLSQPSAIATLVAASSGYDVPPFKKLRQLTTWAEEGPPKGTLYHYPNPDDHQILSIAGAPAPPAIAQQIYAHGVMTKMVQRQLYGEAMEKTLAWAEAEVEGYVVR